MKLTLFILAAIISIPIGIFFAVLAVPVIVAAVVVTMATKNPKPVPYDNH